MGRLTSMKREQAWIFYAVLLMMMKLILHYFTLHHDFHLSYFQGTLFIALFITCFSDIESAAKC